MRLLTADETVNIGGGTCWSDWSRCSGWSQVFTGRAWKTCNARCVNDFGKRGGRCELRENTCSFLPRGTMVSVCICY